MKCAYKNYQYRDEHDNVDVIAINLIDHFFVSVIPQHNTAKAINHVMKRREGGLIQRNCLTIVKESD